MTAELCSGHICEVLGAKRERESKASEGLVAGDSCALA